MCITTLCSPLLLVVGTEEVFPAEAGPVLAASRCGRLGVAASHCGSSTSPRPTPMSIEMGEFPCKGLVNAWSCLNGDCKKKFRSRKEDGEPGGLVTFRGELNEKLTSSFLIPSSEGEAPLLGVSGVRRAGSLVRLVLKSSPVIAPGVTYNNKHV